MSVAWLVTQVRSSNNKEKKRIRKYLDMYQERKLKRNSVQSDDGQCSQQWISLPSKKGMLKYWEEQLDEL